MTARAALVPGKQYVSEVGQVGRAKGEAWTYVEPGATEGLHHFTRNGERCVFNGEGWAPKPADDCRAALEKLLAATPRCTESVDHSNTRCQRLAVRSWCRIPTHCEKHGRDGELLGGTHWAPVPRVRQADAIEAAEAALAAQPLEVVIVATHEDGDPSSWNVMLGKRLLFDIDNDQAVLAVEGVAEALGARVVRR